MVVSQSIVKNHLKYEDGSLYWIDFSIRPNAKKSALGNVLPSGYVCMKFFKKTMYVHRLVFLYHHGYMPNFVDHINGCKTDNRIENLRDVTRCQNMMNVKKTSKNTSGYKGVSFNKKTNKWVAQIKLNKQHFYLGLFESAEKAYEEYSRVAIEYHGEYANLG